MGVKIDLSGILSKIEKMRDRAAVALFENSLRDSQMYCLFMFGPLRDSGETNSKVSEGAGELVWYTPYARRRYFEDVTPRTPGTTTRWVDTARENHLQDWIAAAQKAAGGNT